MRRHPKLIIAFSALRLAEAVPTENLELVLSVASSRLRGLPSPFRLAALIVARFSAFRASLWSRVELELEILALRHQLAVLQRDRPGRPRLRRTETIRTINGVFAPVVDGLVAVVSLL